MVKNTNWTPISVSVDLAERIENFVNSKEGKKLGYVSKSGFVADAIREKLDELKSFQINFLVKIANELAEANRLKRVELLSQKKYWSSKDGGYKEVKITAEDLEDRA